MSTFTRYPYNGPEDQVTPLSVQAPWTSHRTSRTIAHQLLESSRNLFTLLPPEPRTGQMRLRFRTSAEAHAAADFFASPAEFDLFPVDPPELSARFVVTGGGIDVAQEIDSWTVTISWMEVL